jgi:hypothetical protein
MRFVRCGIVTGFVTTLCVVDVYAQNAAPMPAGVTRQTTAATWVVRSDSGQTSVRTHVMRGSIIGGVVGLGLSGLAFVMIRRSDCPVFAPSAQQPDGGSCSNMSLFNGTKLLLGGVAAGAAIGSLLGYTYHVNENEERARRCRANPSACP